MFLLMIPISALLGLMSLQVGLLTKSGLWSFSVMNESLDAETSTRSSISSFSAIFLSFRVIVSGTFGLLVSFCYIFVYKCHIVLGFSLVIVGRFVCFYEDVLLFSYFFDVCAELFLETVRVSIGLEFHSLYHVKHAVLKVIRFFYVWWCPFRFKPVSFFGR